MRVTDSDEEPEADRCRPFATYFGGLFNYDFVIPKYRGGLRYTKQIVPLTRVFYYMSCWQKWRVSPRRSQPPRHPNQHLQSTSALHPLNPSPQPSSPATASEPKAPPSSPAPLSSPTSAESIATASTASRPTYHASALASSHPPPPQA